jgi:hypothetical protein
MSAKTLDSPPQLVLHLDFGKSLSTGIAKMRRSLKGVFGPLFTRFFSFTVEQLLNSTVFQDVPRF